MHCKIINDMADSTADNKYLAMVATNDDRLGQLIAAMLTPLGFNVRLIHRGESQGESMNDFALLIVDGDPIYPINDLSPAVIVISPSDQIAVYDDGADLVVNKPLEANIFLARIRSVLRRYGIKL